MDSVRATYNFMEKSNFRALMPVVGKRRLPFFETPLRTRALEKRYGTAKDFMLAAFDQISLAASFRPRKFLIGLMRSLQKRGVRFFQHNRGSGRSISPTSM